MIFLIYDNIQRYMEVSENEVSFLVVRGHLKG